MGGQLIVAILTRLFRLTRYEARYLKEYLVPRELQEGKCMTSRRIFSVSLLVMIISSGVLALTDRTQSEQVKVKIKNGKVLVRDKSKPVRKELEAAYARLSAAIQNRDFAAFQLLRTADFSSVDQIGNKQTTEQMTARAQAMLNQIQPPINVTFTLGTIDAHQDTGEATVTVQQQFSRMQVVGGELRKVETSATQDETWLKTPEGWKLNFVQGVRDLKWFVDGKRVEPGKPYDPSAPIYEPKEK